MLVSNLLDVDDAGFRAAIGPYYMIRLAIDKQVTRACTHPILCVGDAEASLTCICRICRYNQDVIPAVEGYKLRTILKALIKDTTLGGLNTIT